MFTGESEQTIDSTSRVIIPVTLREGLKETFYMCRGLNESCIWLLPERVFKALIKDIRSKITLTDKNGQNWIRRFTASAVQKNLDGQNRLTLPPNLKEIAGITERVKIIGNGDRVEIWALEKIEEIEKMDFYEMTMEMDEKYNLITGFMDDDS